MKARTGYSAPVGCMITSLAVINGGLIAGAIAWFFLPAWTLGAAVIGMGAGFLLLMALIDAGAV